MNDDLPEDPETRVLLLPPTARDGVTSREVLEKVGIRSSTCASLTEVCSEASRGAGAVVITAEALLGDGMKCLENWLSSQPPWSDLPIVVLTPPGHESPKFLQAIKAVGNFTLMQRPVQVSTFTSTIQSALRDRNRQFAIREMLVERDQTAEALRNADRRKDEFLATLAHELRNPLAPVRNAVQVFHMNGPSTSELQWARDVIDRQVQAMTRLIDDLMDVSRIRRDKLELRKELIELKRVVEGAVETSRPLVEQMGHQLSVTLPSIPILLEGDLTRLEQVFLNLLNNAAKYTEIGGRIDLRGDLQGNEVSVSVKDTGIGIPPGKLPSVFDMFSQVQDAMSRSQGGLGIGLCLVKRLVEMHGGSVEAKSSGLGNGSEFVVRLPVVVDSREIAKADSGDAETLRSRLRILVVDDNRDAASTLAMLLRLMGNHIRTAHDGEEAIQAAGEFQPQVILLDIGLPKMNGYKVARAIREEVWGQNMILIAVTGWGQDDDRRKSEDAGFDRHMVKPVEPKSLMKLLAELQIVIS